jgi:hypothetical protein
MRFPGSLIKKLGFKADTAQNRVRPDTGQQAVVLTGANAQTPALAIKANAGHHD